MSTLSVALQDGFKDDSVVLTVNDREVFRKSGVSTNLVIGLAEHLETQVDGNEARIQIEISSRSKQKSATVRIADTPNVGISIGPDGTPEISVSREPFRYM
jgi:hypothetical protein